MKSVYALMEKAHFRPLRLWFGRRDCTKDWATLARR